MKYWTNKQKIGFRIILVITLVVFYVTLKFSGHKESLEILVIGLFFIDLAAIFIILLLYAFKFLKNRVLLIFMAIIILSLIGFITYHRSYDSYGETRSILWGLNGEVDKRNDY